MYVGSCRSHNSFSSEVPLSELNERVSELKLDNDRLSSEVSRLTDELDSMSSAARVEVRAGRRREDMLDREVRRLREKLEQKQRAMCQRDEQLSSRNVELVFLAGQLVKVSQGHKWLIKVIYGQPQCRTCLPCWTTCQGQSRS